MNVVRFCPRKYSTTCRCLSLVLCAVYALSMCLYRKFIRNEREQHRRNHECAVPFCFVRAHRTLTNTLHTHSLSLSLSIWHSLLAVAFRRVLVCVRVYVRSVRLTNARACALIQTHNDRLLKTSNMLPIHGSPSSKWIQLPFDCPNGWLSWRIFIAQLRIESSHCGWEETGGKDPGKDTICCYNTRKPRANRKKRFFTGIIQYRISHCDRCRNKGIFASCDSAEVQMKIRKFNSRNYLFAICWPNWASGLRFPLRRSDGRIFGCILHRTRNAYKSHERAHSVTLIRSVNCVNRGECAAAFFLVHSVTRAPAKTNKTINNHLFYSCLTASEWSRAYYKLHSGRDPSFVRDFCVPGSFALCSAVLWRWIYSRTRTPMCNLVTRKPMNDEC